MQRYYLLDREIESDDPGFEALLGRAYTLHTGALCLCRRDVELKLYISQRLGSFVLSRWPGTGQAHIPGCEHYEAPDFLTGKGEVQGTAIVEDDAGDVSLKFGFPLSRGAARSAPGAMTNEKPTVVSKGHRLSMRGLLHFLWDRAELTHWHPRMANKRNWFVVRRAVVNAALGCRVRGEALMSSLFVPEPFQLDRNDDIEKRRRSELGEAYASLDAIMVIVGEVKTIEPARYGEKIMIRHLPDWPFLMDEDMAKRFHRRFAVEEELWRSDEDGGHLMMAASFSIGRSGLPHLYEMAVMPVTAQWLPYETRDERSLIAKAVTAQRRFVKGLRFNLASEKPIASIALKDTGPEATAVYLARNLPDPAQDEALGLLLKTPGVHHQVWRPGETLPAVVSGSRPVAVQRPAGTLQ